MMRGSRPSKDMGTFSGKERVTVELRAYRILIAAILAGLAACTTTPKVYSDYNEAVNFGAYKTFAILPLRASGSGVDPGAALRLTQPVQQAVRDALTSRGLREVAREQADFAVSVRGESLATIEVTDFGYTAYPYPYGTSRAGWAHYGGYGRYGGYPPYGNTVSVQNTNQRKLIVEIFDGASKQEAWVGWMEQTSNSKVDAEQVVAGVRLILGGFPPGSEAR